MYKKSKSVDFYIAGSQTLVSVRMRCLNIVQKIPELLKYNYIKFKSVQGGASKVINKLKNA